MLDGMIIFNPSPSRSLESATFSIVGRGSFQNLAFFLETVFKACLNLAEFNPLVCLIE